MSKVENKILFRTKIIFAVLIVITLLITVRLVVLKISKPLKDTKSVKVVVPVRGSIYSSDNEILAISLQRYNVLVDYKVLLSLDELLPAPKAEYFKTEKEINDIVSSVFDELTTIFPQTKKKDLLKRLNSERKIEKKNRLRAYEISQWASAFDKNKWDIFLESLPDSLESDLRVKNIIANSIVFKDFKDISTVYYDIIIDYDALFKEKKNFESEEEFDEAVTFLLKKLNLIFSTNKEKALLKFYDNQKNSDAKEKEYLLKQKVRFKKIKEWNDYVKKLHNRDTENTKIITLINKSITTRRNKYNSLMYMRKNPYKNLAFRTIGSNSDSLCIIENPQYNEMYEKGEFTIIKEEDIQPFFYQEVAKGSYGLEKFYNDILQEKIGIGLHKKIEDGNWALLDYGVLKEAAEGKDIYSSINISYQNFVDSELKRKLYETSAEWGTAILMEVSTGKIRAIANLGVKRYKDTVLYEEDLNYAAGSVKNSDFPQGKIPRPEPGSTFKLASLLLALEDYDIDINDTIDCEKGKATINIGQSKITVSDPVKYGKLSIKDIFEKSSNIGFAKLIDKYYHRNPQQFYKGLHKLYLDTLLGVSIPGERKSNIVTDEVAYVKLSHGYGWEVSPLQILTLYNAVANNGEMLRPLFVDSIVSANNKTVVFDKEVLNPKICSPKTLKILQDLLLGAVQNGTGKKLRNKNYLIAGKTGTSQINYREAKIDNSTEIKHYGSFVGYFPADNPKYTLLVGIYKVKSGKQYYGGDVAAPVFGNIADKIYSVNSKFYSKNSKNLPDIFPKSEKGNLFELNNILSYLGYDSQENRIKYKWGAFSPSDNEIKININKLNNENLVPNVLGFGLRDAVEILEERGLKVKVIGNGVVKKQSIVNGRKIIKGQSITLTLKNK